MTEDQIKSIIALGEGYQAEFKINVPSKVRELTEEICAFANAAGGIILIGVTDNNQLNGVTIENHKRSAIQQSIGEISPPLRCHLELIKIEGVEIAVIEVPSGKNKPYVFSGAIYVRVGPNSQKLTSAAEMRDFFQQSGKLYFDETPCHGFELPELMDQDNFTVFRNEAGLSSSISNAHVFENLQLFTDDLLVKSGTVLFFGSNPEFYFPQAIIRCVSFRGTDKRFITDDKAFGGPLYQQYLQAMNWLRGKINVSYDIEGQGGGPRKEIWEIPEIVFKEAMINALSHRDYDEKGATIMVEVFDDRIEISNPGGLLSAIRSEFGKRSMSRNPLIFGLFERMRLVEKIGSGIPRMKELMESNGLTAPEYQLDGVFTVTLRKAFAVEKWVEKWVDHLSEKRILILKTLLKNPSVSKQELQQIIGISATAIDNNLHYLKKLGLVMRVGPDKGGEWRIIFKTPGG